jgi:hypothetical protein
MATITLSAFEINIRPIRETNNLLILSDFANGNDLLDFLTQFIGNWQTDSQELIDNTDMQKVLRLSHNTLNPFGRKLSGIVESGHYGYSAEIIDITSGESVHQKGVNHAELIPFYFHLFIPTNKTKGILILQRFKQFGIYRIFSDAIGKEFTRSFSGFKIILKPLLSDDIAYNLINQGQLKKITFKTSNLSPSILKAADENENENFGRIEYSIVANRGCSLPFLKGLQEKLKTSGNIPELFGLAEFESNLISVTVKLNGKSRTLDLSTLDDVGAYFDITDQVEINKNSAHPEINSIREISNGIINDLLVSLFPEDRLN